MLRVIVSCLLIVLLLPLVALTICYVLLLIKAIFFKGDD